MKKIISIVFSFCFFSLLAEDQCTDYNLFRKSIQQNFGLDSSSRYFIDNCSKLHEEDYKQKLAKNLESKEKLEKEYQEKKNKINQEHSENIFIAEFLKLKTLEYNSRLQEIKDKQTELYDTYKKDQERLSLIILVGCFVAQSVKKEVKQDVDFDSWSWYGYRSYLINNSLDDLESEILQTVLDEISSQLLLKKDFAQNERFQVLINALSRAVKSHAQKVGRLNGPVYHLPTSFQKLLGVN